MTDSSLEILYNSKQTEYFGWSRSDMVQYVPTSARKILDVGCGSAGFSGNLKTHLTAEVWGVELNQAASEVARGRLDRVFHAPFGPELDIPKNYFDCIIFNDVLEHMLDPLAALQLAVSLLSEKGVIVASIPNIGHFPILWKLAIRGAWDYKDCGILDKTHLRFFTRSSIKKMFDQAGLEVRRVEGINGFCNMEEDGQKLWWRYRLISWLPARGVHDMRYLQFAVVAGKK